ncbi:MAG TPA: hypothetical protein DEB39_04835 [Planctomycetaceae bacterium]|nr:hypothetical protein [Planctomycetaceae bacterium]
MAAFPDGGNAPDGVPSARCSCRSNMRRSQNTQRKPKCIVFWCVVALSVAMKPHGRIFAPPEANDIRIHALYQ